MKENFQGLPALRSGVCGARAMPWSSVLPVQNTLLSRRTIDTSALATGTPLSRRVTKTSVFCGLSLTVMPRLVTCTRVAIVLSPPYGRAWLSGCPGFTAAHTKPVPDGCSARDRSSPCDWMASAVRPSVRWTAGVDGER